MIYFENDSEIKKKDEEEEEIYIHSYTHTHIHAYTHTRIHSYNLLTTLHPGIYHTLRHAYTLVRKRIRVGENNGRSPREL